MIIFAAIAIASFLLVAGAFLFGHDHDADASHDADGAGDTGEHSSSVLSVKVIGMLFMGFGAAGAIARAYDAGYFTASVVGLVCGLALAAIMNALLGLIARQQASSLVPTESLVGCTGTVTVPIGAGELGEVGVSASGQYNAYVAKACEGRAIEKGRHVRVVQAVGSQLVVEEIQD